MSDKVFKISDIRTCPTTFHIHQCSKLTSARRPMADNSRSRLTFLEKNTIASSLMTDTISDINMKMETVDPVG